MASMKWLHYLVVLSSNVSMVTDHLLRLYLFYGMVATVAMQDSEVKYADQ